MSSMATVVKESIYEDEDECCNEDVQVGTGVAWVSMGIVVGFLCEKTNVAMLNNNKR